MHHTHSKVYPVYEGNRSLLLLFIPAFLRLPQRVNLYHHLHQAGRNAALLLYFSYMGLEFDSQSFNYLLTRFA